MSCLCSSHLPALFPVSTLPNLAPNITLLLLPPPRAVVLQSSLLSSHHSLLQQTPTAVAQPCLVPVYYSTPWLCSSIFFQPWHAYPSPLALILCCLSASLFSPSVPLQSVILFPYFLGGYYTSWCSIIGAVLQQICSLCMFPFALSFTFSSVFSFRCMLCRHHTPCELHYRCLTTLYTELHSLHLIQLRALQHDHPSLYQPKIGRHQAAS